MFYYVRDSIDGVGNAVGDGGRYITQQIGDWDAVFPLTTAYYPSIVAAFAATTPPVAGDKIFISSIHDHTYAAGNQLINGPSAPGSNPVELISVDDIDIESYLKGGVERTLNTADGFLIDEQVLIWGLFLDSKDSLEILSSANVLCVNSTLRLSGSADTIKLLGLNSLDLENCVLQFDNFSNDISVNTGGSGIRMNGGSIKTISAGLTALFTTPGVNTADGIFIGVDLSAITGFLIIGFGENTNSRRGIARFERCKLNPSLLGITDKTYLRYSQEVLATNCGATLAEMEYQFYYQAFGGRAEAKDSTGIIRQQSRAFPSGERVSVVADTDVGVSEVRPFYFDAFTQQFDFTVNTTLRIHFAVVDTVTLTDSNCWVEVSTPDATTPDVNVISNRQAAFWDPGVEHSLDVGSTWLDNGVPLTGHKEYFMDVDLSANPPSSSVPIIRIGLSIPSVTIYFDPTVGQI